MLIGHFDAETGKTQSLKDHLFNVANLASNNAENIQLSKIGYLLGILHDLGKSDRNFQKKLRDNSNKRVNHSSAGGKYFFEYIMKNRNIVENIQKQHQSLFYEFLEVVIYVITSHHGIYDIWHPNKDENHIETRLKYEENKTYYYKEDVLKFAKDLETDLVNQKNINFTCLIIKSFSEYINLDEKLKPKDDKDKAFYVSMKVRLLLSILKNADIEDTINAYEKIVKPFNEEEITKKKERYLKEVENIYSSFSNPKNRMNVIRTRLGEEGLKRGMEDGAGIYQLNLPTGAGKTLISLRYGMHQLNNQNKAKFIYITPFLSVLEQNAAEIKSILKDPDIIEHHSNVEKEGKNNTNYDGKSEAFNNYLIDTWDSPIVLSTMVQFFQTLFKGKSANIRRFSSLKNAVIVLDEVQSLPVNVIHLFNLTMNFLSQVMGVTVIMCTATQPAYDSNYIEYKMNYGGLNGELANLVHLSDEERSVFKRTEVHKLNGDKLSTVQDITQDVINHPKESVLVILNTKNAVKQVYEELEHMTDRQIFYLSTNLCPRHRQRIIKDMKESLKKNRPIICVSTQLIEAGVDIDFDRLIRSYAGIDSIIQSMGRCNRHGNKINKGIVNLVKTDESFENITRIEEIREKANVTSYILNRISSPIDIMSLNDDFYEKYYANNQDKMDYPLSIKDSPSGFEYLSTNKASYELSMKKKTKFIALNQSFQTAARHINLIKNDTKGVIVYYKESKILINKLIDLVNDFEMTYDANLLPKIKEYIQKLQPYTINMYTMFKNREKILTYLDGTINILVEKYYDKKMGVIEEIDSSFIY